MNHSRWSNILSHLTHYSIMWQLECSTKWKWNWLNTTFGLLRFSVGKESACNVEDLGSIPVFGRSPREGDGNTLYYSCLENSVDRGACWATVHGVTKGGTRLNDWAQHMLITYIVRLYHIVCPSPRVYLSVWRCYSSWTVNILYVLCILEKEMVPHSIILVWRIPWTEETCGLQSIWSQRVGHEWSDIARTHTGYALYTTTHEIQPSHIK